MDSDGGNQRQLTHLNSLTGSPAISPDGKTLTFMSYAHGYPNVIRYSTESLRELPFANQHDPASVAAPSFTPDGSHVLYSVAMSGVCCQIVIANLDGSNTRSITASDSNNAEPKVNPKTGAQIAFVSGRSGHAQLYLMDIDGTATERLSDNSGDVANPSWNPNGEFLAYAGTRGYGANGWNIFYFRNVAKREIQQVTNNEGKNEHPSWAPDGAHLVFTSTRTGKWQIWSVLANGTQLRQLTTQGINTAPVWGN
jgi:TolB protein